MAGAARGRTLIVVSGVVRADLDAAIGTGERPRADFSEIAAACGDARILDLGGARSSSGVVGRLIERVAGTNVLLAWACWRRQRSFQYVLTDGEHVGLPFAVLRRMLGGGPVHAMVVHVMSVSKKSLLYRWLGLGRQIDRYITYASSQTSFLRSALGVPAEVIHQTPFMVDTAFFSPEVVVPAGGRRICAVGLERRDYATLVLAVEGLDVEVVIAAASPWARRGASLPDAAAPPNVQICSLDPVRLRQLYADSRFLVMPLHEVDFQAGVTALLEAMSMSRAVICSRTAGQTDVVTPGVTGIYVPPGDVAALRTAIVELLDDPDRCAEMGAAGRRWVVEHCDVGSYATRIAAAVKAGGGDP